MGSLFRSKQRFEEPKERLGAGAFACPQFLCDTMSGSAMSFSHCFETVSCLHSAGGGASVVEAGSCSDRHGAPESTAEKQRTHRRELVD